MTLSTEVYIHAPVDHRALFLRCNQLIGANEATRWTDNGSSIGNKIDQGLCALLNISYGHRPAEAHDEWCEDDCTGTYHDPENWAVVDFDTAYGYNHNGERCGDLHARLVAELGAWLDDKGLDWSWRNEFTGEIYHRYDGLTGLCEGGAEATAWFRDFAAPAIAAHIAASGEAS